MRYGDGGFSLHGRTDDVINVSGHRMGTEEIEGAILRDKQLNAESPVGNVIVVGAPHREKGLTPLAFVTIAAGRQLTADDRRRLVDLVRTEKGAVAVPEDFLEVPAVPRDAQRQVRASPRARARGIAAPRRHETLRNPEVVPALERVINEWQARQRVRESSSRCSTSVRYFRVQYHSVGQQQGVDCASRSSPSPTRR